MTSDRPSSRLAYHYTDGQLMWGDKVLAQHGAGDWDDLGHGMARAGKEFWLHGVKIKPPGARFAMLGPNYARDEAQAYLVMQRKLKPISKAAADDFRVIGTHHAISNGTVWHLDKPVRTISPESLEGGTLRALSDHYLTDGLRLFFATNPIADTDTQGIDWSKAELRAFEENAVNPSDLVVGDGHGVLLYLPNLLQKNWMRLADADFAKVAPLPAGDGAAFRSFYYGDEQRIWFLGEAVPVADVTAARLAGPTVLVADGAVFHDGKLTQLRADDLRWIDHDFYCGPGGVWCLTRAEDPQCVAATSKPAPWEKPLQEVAEAAMRKVIAQAFALFDALKDDLSDDDYGLHLPVDAPWPDARLGIECADDEARLLIDGKTVASGKVYEYFRMAAVAWARLQEREDEYLVFPQGNWLPATSLGRDRVVGACVGDVIGLASALYAHEFEKSARHLAHEALYVHRRMWWPSAMHRKFPPPDALADLHPCLASEARYRKRQDDFVSTTNLAAAREACVSGLLDDHEWQVRWEMIRLFNGLASDVQNKVQFLREIVPQLLARREREDDTLLRECWLDVFEMSARRAVGGRWDVAEGIVHDEAAAAAARPLIAWLVEQRVNLALNLARRELCG